MTEGSPPPASPAVPTEPEVVRRRKRLRIGLFALAFVLPATGFIYWFLATAALEEERYRRPDGWGQMSEEERLSREEELTRKERRIDLLLLTAIGLAALSVFAAFRWVPREVRSPIVSWKNLPS